jgi:hypothetical protein
MWLFFSDAFLSVVDNREKKGFLTVRARFKDHISNVFPEAEVVTDRWHDYYYRAYVTRERVAEAVQARIMELDYPNFKQSITNDAYHAGCIKVWQAMYEAGGREKIKPEYGVAD